MEGYAHFPLIKCNILSLEKICHFYHNAHLILFGSNYCMECGCTNVTYWILVEIKLIFYFIIRDK